MELHSLMVLLHILLLVFWLGTDLGVFVAAKMSERSDLSVETRMTLMQLAMILDRLPRTALVLMLPSGLHLADSMQLIALSQTTLTLIWAAALVWVALLWAGFSHPETKLEKTAQLANFALQCVLIVVLAFALFRLWDSLPLWLAMKLLALTLIFVCGVTLDLTFKPAVDAFKEIVVSGATPERDTRYRSAIAPVYWWVLAIYLLVIVATYFGVVKPT